MNRDSMRVTTPPGRFPLGHALSIEGVGGEFHAPWCPPKAAISVP
jgi:hypothetical protein